MSTVPVSSLSQAQQASFTRSPTTPRIFVQVYPAPTRGPTALQLEIGIASGDSEAYVKRVDADFDKLKKFDAVLFQYFKVAKLHDSFPKAKLAKTGGLGPAFQKYFEDILSLSPGVFIFPGFLDIFQIDAGHFSAA
jgi:hypothetical protein